jgi:hypothetical protein
LPDNAAVLLADWGRHTFDRTSQPEIREDTSEFIMLFERGLDQAQRSELTSAVREAGLASGEWAVCGAWEVIVAFLDPTPQEVLDELSEARVRYLLSLDHPNLSWHLNGEDMITLQRLDPDAYARLQP